MRYTLPAFYSDFYGIKFARLFVRVPLTKCNPSTQLQYKILTPKQLQYQVNRNSGHFKCFISVYSYGSSIQDLNGNYKEHPSVDRVFFDFDLESAKIKNALDELKNLRKNGLNYNLSQQQELLDYIYNCIVNENASIDPINQAKRFAEYIYDEYGNYPVLVFSGFKGCHAYCFFEPVHLEHINGTIHSFADDIMETQNLGSMDLSVNKDPDNRKSRIPFSKHEITGLNVVPFHIDDSYEEIINKALNPTIQPFDLQDHLTTLNNHLEAIDKTITPFEPERRRRQMLRHKNQRNGSIMFNRDNRTFFQEVLGPPEMEYQNYDVYYCPFTDHTDTNPSFVVYSSGYKCFGCGRRGNYWKYLKERRGFSDKQIRKYLKLKQFKNFN